MKFVQIITNSGNGDLFALAEDGTVWQYHWAYAIPNAGGSTMSGWKQLSTRNLT